MSAVFTGMGPANNYGHILFLLLTCILNVKSTNHEGDVLDLIPLLKRTSSPGIQYITGPNNITPAIRLTDSQRVVILPDAVSAKAQRFLRENIDITFLATLKQEIGDSGSILSLSTGINRILEIESSGRRNEVRFYYTHDQKIQIETFPYKLADNHWHKLALSLSATDLTLFVDCEQIYRRVILTLDTNFKADKISLFLGQRNREYAHFRGALQDVKIVTKSHGYLIQCPHQDTSCPTCAQHQHLQKMYEKMQSDIQDLNKKLLQAEERLLKVEQSPCHYCIYNDTMKKEGERWSPNKCTVCICKNTSVICKHRDCSVVDCRNPVYRDCCKPASDNCCIMDNNEYYNPGEKFQKSNCFYCACDNASIVCNQTSCPELNCSKDSRIYIDGECCPICNGTNFCALDHNCHVNATCVNLTTRYICQCKSGFHGNGTHCKDIDECVSVGGKHGHHCNGNTVCVNTIGSYRCQCANKMGDYGEDDSSGSCEGVTVDCSPNKEDEKPCHVNAVCTQIGHTYRCKCKDGYRGNGRWCQPVCESECKNGGRCIAPNKCECRYGYVGKYCENDINECKLGIDACQGQSECVNIPGWYYCRCKQGYDSSWHQHSMYGLQCADLNECLGEGDGHTCHPSTKCYNTDGSYECRCKYKDDCSHGCIFEGYYHENNSRWISEIDVCSDCSCKRGVVKCHQRECDCSKRKINYSCCPHCAEKRSCPHQEHSLEMSHGQKWVYECQTCECLSGEVDCWPLECPKLMCSDVVKMSGDCCPRCIDDDPCHENDQYSVINAGLIPSLCRYHGRKYRHNDHWNLHGDKCTTCKCKRGHICCSFNQTCTALERSP
ncbi:protein kinase C-binding protein NELL1 isoform X1 [Octopus sinensis]|uniref:Protein kinase C-binding protein NELL1 isoform X1 n=1 Tax=Octopus sinensis TaxID=2607531 RepID=A0A6P7TJN8_9MOLL|nr:protein kinase C-binding protein NELL1 isoform X1 [Octopus sinensis]